MTLLYLSSIKVKGTSNVAVECSDIGRTINGEGTLLGYS